MSTELHSTIEGPENFRRAAKAVRNLMKNQPLHSEWCRWVPEMLDRVADEMEATP